MKKIKLITAAAAAAAFCAMFINGCAVSQEAASKSGAQLWGENCLRCHDAPSPAEYGDTQWEVVSMHMKVRANNLSDTDMKKVVEFLQSAN